MKNILVTGGAGYIGSITAHELAKSGYNPIIYDSMEYGHKEAVAGLELVIANTLDQELLAKTIKKFQIDGIIHFAAYIQMGESMQKPYKYFYNNFLGSLSLLETAVKNNVNKIVFSSTAGVYGNSDQDLIKEDSPKNPTNPYGESKLMTEKALNWFGKIHNLLFVALRYFNAAGANLDGKLGESHRPETHLIPNIMESIIQKKPFVLHGNNYHTPDGTCIRDYIHVLDLAKYHILSLEHLDKGGKSMFLNAGTGRGYSNMQVLGEVEKVSGKKADINIGKPRPGDGGRLVADNTKISQFFNYIPQYSDLSKIVETAWKWHNSKCY